MLCSMILLYRAQFKKIIFVVKNCLGQGINWKCTSYRTIMLVFSDRVINFLKNHS